MDDDHVTVTRDGAAPHPAGRDGVADALGRLLDAGRRFADPGAELDAQDVRAWAVRLGELAGDLADCVEAPARNRVLEALGSPSVPEDACALTVLRLNVLGESVRGLAVRCGFARATIERLEDGLGCTPATAKQLADVFSLKVLELFSYDVDADGALTVRTVGELRDIISGAQDRA